MNIEVQFGGKDAGLFAVADSVKRRVNEITQASQKTTNSQRAIADLERQLATVEGARARQAWERLSTEQKIATLKQKQVELEKAATKAAEGSLLARGIGLKQSIVAAQIATLQAGGGGGLGFGGMLRPFLPLLSGVGAGALGSIAGGLAAGGIGAAVAVLTGAIFSSAKSAMEFADSIGDAATTLRMSSEETLRLFRAAARAGIGDSAAAGALSRLESVRASAASGDIGAINLLKRYGVTSQMINDPEVNVLTLASAIRSSLGAGGMLTEDRNALGKLFGRRPEKMISILGQMGDPNPKSEKTLKVLEQGNDAWEGLKFSVKDMMLYTWGKIAREVKKYPGGPAYKLLFPMGTPDPVAGSGPRTAAPSPDVSVDPENMSTWEDYQTLLDADRSSRRSMPRGAAAAGASDALSRIGLYNAPGSESLGTTATRLLESSRRIESKLDRLNAEAEREG